ncbi:MAG: hypothetical protein ABI740_08990, partial [Alphaproteobacteria bacterium]
MTGFRLLLSRRAALAGGLAALAPTAGAQTAVRVQVEIDENGHVLAPIRIDGESCLAQIDNGFAASALDLGFAQARKLASSTPTRVNGAPTVFSAPLRLAFAGRTIEMRPRLVDLSVSAIAGLRPRAVIGRDVLDMMGLTIDAKQGWIETRGLDPDADLPAGLSALAVSRTSGGDLTTDISVENGQ